MSENTKTSTNEKLPMKNYDRGYKWLHWVMAPMIFIMFFAMQGFAVDMSVAEHTQMLTVHSSIGTIITMLLFVSNK